jgi:hypothetical protein
MKLKCIENLKKYGNLLIAEQKEETFEFKISDGFSSKAENTFNCMKDCMDIAIDYPYIDKCITEENNFHLILKKINL